MSLGLTHGKRLDHSGVGLTSADLPPLPDDVTTSPRSGWFDARALFDTPGAPLEIEIGSGKGTFLVQQAALQPDVNFLGFEWTREFWRYAADRLRRNAITNVRLVHGDASEFLHWRAPDACARVIHLYFPDPWPKSRHHKRRMVSDRFLADAHRVLLPAGELRIVTDHDDYWAWMEEHFARWTAPGSSDLQRRDRQGAVSCQTSSASSSSPPFERMPFERPASAGEGEVVGTNFERKYRREGRPFHATILRKAGAPC